MIISGSLDIGKPVPPSLETICNLLGRGKTNKGDEGLRSREIREYRRGWVYPDRSYRLCEQGEFILGFLLTGVREKLLLHRLKWVFTASLSAHSSIRFSI